MRPFPLDLSVGRGDWSLQTDRRGRGVGRTSGPTHGDIAVAVNIINCRHLLPTSSCQAEEQINLLHGLPFVRLWSHPSSEYTV